MNPLRLYAPGLLLAALGLVLGCGHPPATVPEDNPPAPTGPAWFKDVTSEMDLPFRHEAGPTDRFFMPQVMGSGCALFDFDNSGRLGLYLVQNAGPDSKATNCLYRQTAEGRFEDVSAGSGLDIAGFGMGVAVGDFDNDGWLDVYVSQYGGGRLFRNRGKDATGRWLGFEEVTAAAGVALSHWGTSCAFFDYDRDGWLDLVVVHYVDYNPSQPCGSFSGKPDYCHPSLFPGTQARLFHNRGKDASGRWLGFEDVTVKSGLAKLRGPGLGVVCADFNGDGWPDLFVANDYHANYLWINRGDGTFTEEGVLRGVAYNGLGNVMANMGVAFADVDGDGWPDLFVTHLTEELHVLWQQTRPGYFKDRTAALGLAAPRYRGTGFGTIFADFDNDGWVDLAVVNGRVSRAQPAAGTGLPPFWTNYAERNQLFANRGDGRFRDVSTDNPAFCGTAALGRGLAWGDLDDDGGVDLVVSNVAGPAKVYRNVAPGRGHWLMVRALDPELKRDAYGAKVTVRAGGRGRVGLINPGQSYLSSGDPRAHFGLGEVTKVEEIRVDWPSGRPEAEIFACPAVDRVIVLKHGEGKPVGK
jgi:hypothetical protein